jgi:hypothetical protein
MLHSSLINFFMHCSVFSSPKSQFDIISVVVLPDFFSGDGADWWTVVLGTVYSPLYIVRA